MIDHMLEPAFEGMERLLLIGPFAVEMIEFRIVIPLKMLVEILPVQRRQVDAGIVKIRFLGHEVHSMAFLLEALPVHSAYISKEHADVALSANIPCFQVISSTRTA